jgi:hypothetical protein
MYYGDTDVIGLSYLYNFAANEAVDVLVCDDHLVVHQPDVTIHVAEVSKHLKAVRTLVFRHLKMNSGKC